MNVVYANYSGVRIIHGIQLEPADTIEEIAAHTRYRVDELINEIERLLEDIDYVPQGFPKDGDNK